MDKSTIGKILPANLIPSSITTDFQDGKAASSQKKTVQKLIIQCAALSFRKKIFIFTLLYLFIIAIICTAILMPKKTLSPTVKKHLAGRSIQISANSPLISQIPVLFTNPLTGLEYPYAQKDNLSRTPIAVMIENSIPARPQAGLFCRYCL